MVLIVNLFNFLNLIKLSMKSIKNVILFNFQIH